MNILPKKRWHVRTKDNIARVRKDEAKAREEEQESLRRKNLAEKEARINELRSRTGHEESKNYSISTQSSEKQIQHVNLFADFEEGLAQTTSTNKEYCKEQLEKAQKYEKQIGLLTFLGQDTNEALKLKSWYELPPEKTQNFSAIEEKDAIVKAQNDPLNVIKKHFPENIKNYDSKCKILENKLIETGRDEKLNIRQKKSKKKNKEKGKIVNKKYSKVGDTSDHLKKLRDERLKREAMEKSREELIVLKANGLKPPMETAVQLQPVQLQPVQQQYNSQFNPYLAKQNFKNKF